MVEHWAIEIDPSQRCLGSHLGNETTTSVLTLIPIESSKMCENIRAV